MQNSNPQTQLHFVNLVTPSSRDERRRNKTLVRAYTAKVNGARRRRHPPWTGQPKLRSPARLKNHRKPETEEQTKSQHILYGLQHRNRCHLQSPPRTPGGELSGWEHHLPDLQSLHHDIHGAERRHYLLVAPPRSLSPTFGAFASCFDSSDFHHAAQVSDFMFNDFLSKIFTSHEVSGFFSKFCQYAVVFHAYAYFHLFVQDMIRGLSIDERRKKLALVSKTLAMMQEKLQNIREEDVEAVLLSMILMPKERSDYPETKRATHLFNVYRTTSCTFDIMRRANSFFLPAARLLVDRKGGLHRLETHGLAKILIW